jgi:hypothetical protein
MNTTGVFPEAFARSSCSASYSVISAMVISSQPASSHVAPACHRTAARDKRAFTLATGTGHNVKRQGQ